MSGLAQVFDAALVSPTGHVLDDTTFDESYAIAMNVFDRLDLEILVVVPAFLGVEGAHLNTSN